jgi:hypothetical protein
MLLIDAFSKSVIKIFGLINKPFSTAKSMIIWNNNHKFPQIFLIILPLPWGMLWNRVERLNVLCTFEKIVEE